MTQDEQYQEYTLYEGRHWAHPVDYGIYIAYNRVGHVARA